MKNLVYGYVRISRRTQDPQRQIRNITAKYPTAIMFEEAFTGTKINRPKFDKLLSTVRSGDTIVFDSVSRMSRNAAEGTETYFKLFDQGISLVFLKEGYINTDVFKTALERQITVSVNSGDRATDKFIGCTIEALNELMKDLARRQIEEAFAQAEKEVNDLHQRTTEGIETARRNGKQIGQKQGAKLTTKKSIAAKEAIRKYSRFFDGTLEDEAVIKLAGCSRNSFYKYKREMRIEA